MRHKRCYLALGPLHVSVTGDEFAQPLRKPDSRAHRYATATDALFTRVHARERGVGYPSNESWATAHYKGVNRFCASLASASAVPSC
jgi:hypothetical protein